MNVVRKLVFLVVILGVIALSVGCQQSGLSEEEIRSIVREEVTRQLATIDKFTVSELCIENEDGRIVAILSAGVLDGAGHLTLFSAGGLEDGKSVASLGPSLAFGSGGLTLSNADGKIVTSLGGMDDGSLFLRNADGEINVMIGSSATGGSLHIYNASGNCIVRILSLIDDGWLVICDKDGKVTFEVP